MIVARVTMNECRLHTHGATRQALRVVVTEKYIQLDAHRLAPNVTAPN